MHNLLSPLKQYFGYTTFHPLQEEIITDILNKKDVFVLMPTGGGKSLCYQLPAIINDGVTVVVSPLIALMKDQVDSLRANGVTSAYINSSLNAGEIQTVQTQLLNNEIKLLYVAPERIMQPQFMPFLQKLSIGLFAIDEAHCISEWGHDFRPEYRQLRTLREKFPNIPIAAFTATAVPEVQTDILAQLKLTSAKTFQASFNRKNLFYKTIVKKNPYHQLLEYLQYHKKDSGIIYCFSRDGTETLAEKLRNDGYKALAYHAGLDAETRTLHQEKFIKDDVEIIVATIAFGMGINKPNVRFVIHYNIPKNIESYYQETGRAGRDGLPSECLLLFSYGDKSKIEYFIQQKEDEREKQIAVDKLAAMIHFAESRVCRRKMLLTYFGENYSEHSCSNCDNCLTPKDTFDGTIPTQKILSCIHRTGERFGMKYIVDILRGSGNEKILQNRHTTLTTYGIGKEYPVKVWQAFIRELLRLGFLELQGEPYPVLKLTERSKNVLFRQEKVFLTKPEKEDKLTLAIEETDAQFDRELFELLRATRKELAESEHVPPYVIFHDTTLKEMATVKPINEETLRAITGIGERKLFKYGEVFLKAIRKHIINVAP